MRRKFIFRWMNRFLWFFSLIMVLVIAVTFLSYNIILEIELTIELGVIYTVGLVLALLYPSAFFIYRIILSRRIKKKVNQLENKYLRITDKQVSEITDSELWKVRPLLRKWKTGVLIDDDTLTYYSSKFIKDFLTFYGKEKNLGPLTKIIYEKMKISLSKNDLTKILEVLRQKNMMSKE